MGTLSSFRLAAASMLIATAACSSGRHVTTQASPRLGASVEVTNTSWHDVVVYTVGSGPRWRLGMVTSMATRTFRLPRHEVGPAGLRLMADPIGSREVFVSDRISISAGQRIELTVAPLLSQSYYALNW